MMKLLGFAPLVVALVVFFTQAGSASASDAENMIVNAGAEFGETAPWTGSDWGAEKYGAPAAPNLEYDHLPESLGSYLFGAESPNARIEQSVSLEELTSSIESGSQQLAFAAWLGGQARGGSSIASVTFLDAMATPIGSPVQIGPIAGSELTEQPILLFCETTLNVPAGARRARVILAGATGSLGASSYGFADNVYLSTTFIGVPASGQYVSKPAETANCVKRVLAPLEPVISPPVIGPGPPQASTSGENTSTLGLAKITAHRGSASASVTCSGASGSSCHGRVTLTTNLHRTAHRRATTINVGSASISLDAGQQATVTIHLSAAGRQLLRVRRALSVRLTVLAIHSASDQTVAARRELILTS